MRFCQPFPSRLLVVGILTGAVGVLSAQQSRRNLVLITLDTVRADRVGAYGYESAQTPALDRLAREGVRFADATSQAPLTGPAHAALLTGMYPGRFGILDNAAAPLPAEAVSLAEILKSAGYRTAAFVGSFILDRPYGFGQGFDDFDSSFDRFDASNKLQARRTADQVLQPATAWLARRSAEGPFFMWVHFYDAHSPYDSPSSFRQKFPGRAYDGAIAYVDAAVDRLLEQLRARGSLERTVVVAIGDHGESLGEHGEAEHGVLLYDSTLQIPWIMRLPGRHQAGRVISEQARTIDLVPTVLDLLGVPTPRPLDGENLMPVIGGRARRDPPASYAETFYPKLHFGWSELRSLRVGDWKFIEAPRPELYDLRADPSEQRNVLADRQPLAQGLASELRKIRAQFGSGAAAAAPVQPDPETLARLRSLGYIGLAAPSVSPTAGADPKDMVSRVEVYRRLITGALDDLSHRRPDAAIEKLNGLMEENQRHYDVHLFLGDAYRQKRDHDKALGEYAAAALLNPNSAAPQISAAEVYVEAAQFDRALQKLAEARGIEPGSPDVALGRGRVFERTGRDPEASAEYEHVRGERPEKIK